MSLHDAGEMTNRGADPTFRRQTSIKGNVAVLYIGTALVVAIVIAAAAAALQVMWQQTQKMTSSTTQNLSLLMEQTYDGLIDTVDIALQSSADEIRAERARGPLDRDATTRALLRQQARVPHVGFLRATDASGNLIYGGPIGGATVNIGGTDYFKALKNEKKSGLYISRAMRSPTGRRWVWLFARRIDKPDGSFGGVILAGFYLGDLDKMLGQIVLRVGGVATLRDADMGVIARHVSRGHNPAPPGNTRIAKPFADALKRNPDKGTYVSGATSIDAISRTQTYRRSAKYRYYVNVGIASDQALSVWRHQAWFVAGLIATFVIVALIFAELIKRSWLRQAEDMTTLESIVGERNRLIADLENSNTDLEQFAYVASHDLQTPLRNMVIYAQLLKSRYADRLDRDADDFIDFIVGGGKQMTRLIGDLLQYSRVTSQSQPLVPVAAGRAVALALRNLGTVPAEAGAEVTVGDLPTVMADESHLVSLFQNLLDNAIKYRAPDRAPRLSVTARPAAPGLWRFAVADNGIGIAPAYHDKIFEIFQRLDPAGAKTGTGIGLTLCRRIVRRFGGTIWVESEPDVGTTFFFTLHDGAVVG
jgi:signal transduction histidine kinase